MFWMIIKKFMHNNPGVGKVQKSKMSSLSATDSGEEVKVRGTTEGVETKGVGNIAGTHSYAELYEEIAMLQIQVDAKNYTNEETCVEMCTTCSTSSIHERQSHHLNVRHLESSI